MHPAHFWGFPGLGEVGLVRLKSFNLYRNAKEMKEFGWSRPKTLVWANNALLGRLESYIQWPWRFVKVAAQKKVYKLTDKGEKGIGIMY